MFNNCGHRCRSACACCCKENASRTETQYIYDPVSVIEKAATYGAVQPIIENGDSLRGTNIDSISSSIGTIRNVSIQITNFTDRYTLSNPRTYSSSGYCLNPPQPTVAKKTSETCTFTKTRSTAHGCAGVLAYKILKDEVHFVGELVIMFSVPFDYNFYENYLALGIYENHVSCNSDLFFEMYYEKGPFTRERATGSKVMYSVQGISVKGTMSPAGKAIMKVDFQDF
ncbi:DELTA-actitoxin-Afr1e-like [Tachysurus fulvidraco]|uniref:DELTA-actitoxin-Afr1e-like n=1 Tax=Tachysurus fulvidraco TaxID=1234273 RepID=UPI000F4D7B7D|nr:DELTA-actitoxin-Afr1e-like [Tachysurus fulvidraco]